MPAGKHTLNVVRSAVDGAPQIAGELASGAWKSTGTRLKSEGGSIVVRTTLAGHDVVVKLRTLTSADRLKALVGHGRGERQWDGAMRLREADIPTAEPLVLLRGTLEGKHVEILVCEFVPGATLLHCLASDEWLRLDSETQLNLGAATGRTISDLTDAGLFNRDHKPSNLIVDGWPETAARVVILDTVAIRRDASEHAAARMLASLVIEPTGVGLAPRLRLALMRRTALAAANHDRELARRLFRAAAKIVREHGDPTPRVNPLG